MRSAANPRRNNDSLARMLAAVAAASLATINGDAARKLPTLVTMQSSHKPPAILAWKRGDDSKQFFVISVELTGFFLVRRLRGYPTARWNPFVKLAPLRP